MSRSEAPLESFGERESVDFQTEETHCAILVAATGRVEATGHEGTRDEAADPKLELGGDLDIANRSDRHSADFSNNVVDKLVVLGPLWRGRTGPLVPRIAGLGGVSVETGADIASVERACGEAKRNARGDGEPQASSCPASTEQRQAKRAPAQRPRSS